MNDDTEYNVSDFSRIRVQLDEILVDQISRLIEIDLTAAALSFNLATISCLYILVERERDIQGAKENPPPRYDMESFLRDLEEIGLEIDDDLIAALQSLAQCGYVEKDQDERYFANVSAFTLVAFLDNLFPGMKGLNLVGYVVQAITEVVTGRRKIEDAKKYLEQTLFSQGIALSKQSFEHSQHENLKQQVRQNNINPVLAEDMQKAYIDRLETLRAIKGEISAKPSFISRYGSGSGEQIKIREVFPRNKPQPVAVERVEEPAPAVVPIKEEPVRHVAEIPAVSHQPEEIIENDSSHSKQPYQEMPIVPELVEETVKEEKAIEPVLVSEEKKKEPLTEVNAPAPKVHEPIDEESEEDEYYASDEEGLSEAEIDDDEIERRVAAFYDEIAISCPICEKGKVKTAETEKGRTYFKCSSAACNFVSWSKPYNFPCPLCNNGFLVEFSKADGTIGLKCPRATCSFSQDSVLNPLSSSSASEAPKKKKKLVRRIKKK